MIFKKLMAFFILLNLWYLNFAQVDPKTSCRVENGKIIFTLDLNWNKEQLKEVSKLFDLDSMLLAVALEIKDNIVYDSVEWKIKQLSPSIIELSKELRNKGIQNFYNIDLQHIGSGFLEFIKIQKGSPMFGINNFKSELAFKYENGIASFFTTQFRDCEKIILSGTFNEWSTSFYRMNRTDSGWIASVPLMPGKYLYKFIVDGKWQLDPGNKFKEKDENGISNSVVFCPNHIFKLKGYINAKKVILSGSFNNWDEKQLSMAKTVDGWQIALFLNEGTHFYKFIVDGNWITDPENEITRQDADGNLNSMLEIGERHYFCLDGFMNAKRVILSGTFNNWSENELVMNKTTSGWELNYVLSNKMHEYKFIVDGHWITDPANLFTAGSGEFANSVLTIAPNHSFQLGQYIDAKDVRIAGNFNNWDPNGFKMSKKEEKWIFPVQLNPGKYLYKFIVDGKWIIDPENDLWEENEHGTNNSILWISE